MLVREKAMTSLAHALLLSVLSAPLFAALPVVPGKDQAAMLESSDPKLAANKKIAYDFYRIVLRGLRLDQAEKYMRNDYIQHNPNADTGIEGFKAYFTKLGGPKPIPDTLVDLVAIQAEGDYVTLSLVREYDDPAQPGKKYTSTWFDMFRIQDGKIAEHWDNATKPVPVPKK
jgi:predicted SnoaL-like aldol condensation-catalyzing enzyme